MPETLELNYNTLYHTLIMFWICQDSLFVFLFAIGTVKRFIYLFCLWASQVCVIYLLYSVGERFLCSVAFLTWSLSSRGRIPITGCIGLCWQMMLWPETTRFSSSCNSRHLLELISWIVTLELQSSSHHVGKLDPSLLAPGFIKKEIQLSLTKNKQMTP